MFPRGHTLKCPQLELPGVTDVGCVMGNVHGLESNPGSSLQTEEEAGLP